MTVHLLHPSARRWRPFLEKEALRIFGEIAGASRAKVERKLLAENIMNKLPRDVAERDVADAMAFLEARIDLYRHAREIELEPSVGRRPNR